MFRILCHAEADIAVPWKAITFWQRDKAGTFYTIQILIAFEYFVAEKASNAKYENSPGKLCISFHTLTQAHTFWECSLNGLVAMLSLGELASAFVNM